MQKQTNSINQIGKTCIQMFKCNAYMDCIEVLYRDITPQNRKRIKLFIIINNC